MIEKITENDIKIVHILTEPSRYKILMLLLSNHYCIKALAKKLNISESAVSQHMKCLKNANLVQGARIGYQVHYIANKKYIISILKKMTQELKTYPDDDEIKEGWNCSCEFIHECVQKDKKLLKEQGYAK